MCSEKLQLMERVQERLALLAELMVREREAIASESLNTVLAIDKQIDEQIGEKERAMGAFHQH